MSKPTARDSTVVIRVHRDFAERLRIAVEQSGIPATIITRHLTIPDVRITATPKTP